MPAEWCECDRVVTTVLESAGHCGQVNMLGSPKILCGAVRGGGTGQCLIRQAAMIHDSGVEKAAEYGKTRADSRKWREE